MRRNQKLLNVFLLSLAIGAVILLSAGISNLELTFGEPFTFLRSPQSTNGPPNFITGGEALVNLLLILFVVVQLLLPFAFIYFLLSREMRKHVFRALFSLLWIFALVFLIRSGRYPFIPAELKPINPLPRTETLTNAIELSAQPPQWLVMTVTISLAVILAIIIMLTVRFLWNRSRRRQSPLQKLVDEAQEAIEALHAGADFKDTIIRCYYEMNHTLREQQGIHRTQAMTPREFQRELVKIGFPPDDVGELTRLFEMVRYGSKIPGEADETLAIRSLASIVEVVKITP